MTSSTSLCSARTSILVLVAAAAVSACGDEVTAPPEPAAPEPARLGVGTPQGVDVAAERTGSVEVTILDAQGMRVPGSTATVTLELAPNPHGASAIGTLTAEAVDGVATFDDVQISRAGSDFVLSANAGGLSGTSDPFDVRLRFSSISVGNTMTCGLSHAGDAYCWGANQTGGLGTGHSGEDHARHTPASPSLRHPGR
jgi:hypothetical protein